MNTNSLIDNLLSQIRETATSFKENAASVEISSVLEVAEQICTVKQLGLYNSSTLLCDHFKDIDGVTYLPVGEEPGLWTCGCFVIPPNGKIPLHDHPEMTGIIRVLEGSVSIESFDICNKTFARSCGTNVFECPSTACLGPTASNIHQVTAGSKGAVFLDILMPDYDDDEGRCCNFYILTDMDASIEELRHNNASSAEEIEFTSADGPFVKLAISPSCDINIFTSEWPSSSPPSSPSSASSISSSLFSLTNKDKNENLDIDKINMSHMSNINTEVSNLAISSSPDQLSPTSPPPLPRTKKKKTKKKR
mmetsp:Transcript_1397/g.1805  ORF Transcript_1397/g.1805 Transcript_1397/m.1805 type:complete len:307 (+) Transcript_1397:89-1009(+)